MSPQGRRHSSPGAPLLQKLVARAAAVAVAAAAAVAVLAAERPSSAVDGLALGLALEQLCRPSPGFQTTQTTLRFQANRYRDADGRF